MATDQNLHFNVKSVGKPKHVKNVWLKKSINKYQSINHGHVLSERKNHDDFKAI